MNTTEHRSDLERFAHSITDIAKTEIRGEGAGTFIYAHASDRAIELSKSEKGIWVEFWREDSEPPEYQRTFDSYDSAISSIRDWFESNQTKTN